MNVVSVIQADLVTGAQGLPSLLGADLDGVPVLQRTVRRAAAAKQPKQCVVIAGSDEDRSIIEAMIGDAPAQVMIVEGDDLPQRNVLRRSRLWSRNGWRGGIGGTTVFDEEGTLAKLVEVARRTDAEGIVFVSAGAVLVQPEMIDRLVDWAGEHVPVTRFFFPDLPPGLTAGLFERSLLEALAKSNNTVQKGLTYKKDTTERDPAESDCRLHVEDYLRLTPFRLSVDSPRTLERVRRIYDDDTHESIRKLKEAPELWCDDLPEEVEIELASPGDIDDPYAAINGSREMTEFMDVDALGSALRELCRMGDINITFGGLGDPLAHARFFDAVASVRKLCVAGVHVVTCGRLLDEEMVDRLAASDLDAVSVLLFADTEDTCEKLTGRRDLARTSAMIDRFIERRQELKRSTPFIIPEMFKSTETVDEMESFFDRWYGRADWVVIRSYNDFAGQLDDISVLHPHPVNRSMCMQLLRRMNVSVTGDIPVCGQDFRGRRVIGNVFRDGFGNIWRGETLDSLRREHVAGNFGGFDLCANCKDWFHL